MAHVYFNAVEDEVLEDAPAANILDNHSAQTNLLQPHCCARVLVDLNRKQPAYVFRATYSPASSAIAASLSTNIIKLYSLASSAQLTHTADLTGHTNTIRDVGFFLPDQPHLLHSASADGSICGWDIRSGQQVESFTSTQELFSFSVLDHIAAGGGPGEVHFWDRRAGTGSATFAALTDTHPEDVTQVKFHPSRKVITASVDGLVAVHDVSRAFDEDDNFEAAMNVDTTPEELGLYGPQGDHMWVRTATETLHLWEWMRAVNDTGDEASGGKPFAEFLEARETAQKLAASSSAAASFPSVDYLLGCHFDPSSQQLMMAGGHEGNVAFWPIVEQADGSGNEAVRTGAALGGPALVLQGAHKEVVRSVQCWGSGQGLLCLTGAEDAQVCLWSLDPSLRAASGAGAGASGAGGNKGGEGKGGKWKGNGKRKHGGGGGGQQQQGQQQGQQGGQQQHGKGKGKGQWKQGEGAQQGGGGKQHHQHPDGGKARKAPY